MGVWSIRTSTTSPQPCAPQSQDVLMWLAHLGATPVDCESRLDMPRLRERSASSASRPS